MTAPALKTGPVRAFTLVELMVSMGLICVVALILVSMTNATASTWRYTTGRIEQFRGANVAFEAISRRLSQATLNTYWDYFDASGKPRTSANSAAFTPSQYGRQSDLRFITGRTETLVGSAEPQRPTQAIFFQAPLGFVDDSTNYGGLDNLLNTWGYYVEFNSDELSRPSFLTPNTVPLNWRYRLIELMQPSNFLSVYKWTSGVPAYAGKDWFTGALKSSNTSTTHVLAENVVALVVLPKLAKKEETLTGKVLSKDYTYDSTKTDPDPVINPKSQLPPIVQVTLVAIDELSATRVANGSAPPAFHDTLGTLFAESARLDADLATLQDTLNSQKIGYRVFTSSVSIRGAKWSTK